MAEGLDWAFRLVDQVSGSALNMVKALNSVNINLDKLTLKLGRTRDEQGKFQKQLFSLPGLKGLGADLGGYLNVLERAYELAKAPFELGKGIIDKFAFKETTLKSFELILGSKEEAKAMFKQAFDFARLTPLETQDVVKSFQQLLAAGFSKTEVPIVFQALGDVATMTGDDQALSAITTQLAQVRGRGKLQEEDLKPIVNWTSAAGVSQDKVFEHIAKNLGIAKSAVADMMKAGSINADVGIFSILEAIKEGPSAGQFGKGMLNNAFTIKGLLSTLSSAWGDFWLSMEEITLPGLSMFKETLQNLSNALDPTSKTGLAVVATLRSAFNEVFGGIFDSFSGPSGAANVEKAILGIVDAFKGLWKIGEGVWGFLKGFVTEFLTALKLDLSGVTLDKFDAIRDGLIALGPTLGKLLGDAVRQAYDFLKGALLGPEAQDLGVAVGHNLGVGIRKGLFDFGTQSAGSVLGEFFHQAIPLIPGIGPILGPLLNPIDFGSGDKAAGASGSPMNVPIGQLPNMSVGRPSASAPQASIGQLHINVDNTGHVDGDEIGRKLAEVLPGHLDTAFRSIAIQKGVA